MWNRIISPIICHYSHFTSRVALTETQNKLRCETMNKTVIPTDFSPPARTNVLLLSAEALHAALVLIYMDDPVVEQLEYFLSQRIPYCTCSEPKALVDEIFTSFFCLYITHPCWERIKTVPLMNQATSLETSSPPQQLCLHCTLTNKVTDRNFCVVKNVLLCFVLHHWLPSETISS